jgi:hypothetical protein
MNHRPNGKVQTKQNTRFGFTKTRTEFPTNEPNRIAAELKYIKPSL